MKITSFLMVVFALAVSGCASEIKEVHYFAAYSGEDRTEPSEFFRLTVTADTQFTNARFVAGYYDERAVDLMFNELRAVDASRQADTCDCQLEPLFQRRRRGDDVIDGLNPSSDNGAFVLILSTNADSVARAISSFSENQLVAEAVTNLVNQDQLQELAETEVNDVAERATARANTTIIGNALERAGQQRDSTAARTEYMRALNAMGRSLGRTEPFADFDEARGWFADTQARLEREGGR